MFERSAIVSAVVLSLTASAWAGEVGFAPNGKPAAARDGEKVRITFTVAAATDVQVAVLDATGKVVRHLGGGMLGDNPPEPFGKGLSQEITWDGKDDLGKAPAGGPFSVRVGLGLKPEFDRIIGWSGQEIENVRGICCGPDGTLYMLYGGSLWAHRQTTLVSAFDRNGKYLRQVLPGPGGLAPEQRKGWPHVKLADGREIPVVWNVMTRAINPAAVFADRSFPAVTPDGRLVVLSGATTGDVADLDIQEGRRLLIVGTDGSVPENYLGPVVAGEKDAGLGFTAVAPDGKSAYVCGVGADAAVWRADLSGQEPAKPFIKDGPKTPGGLAVDKAGNLYISEPEKNRIAVFKADGTPLKNLAINAPGPVQISRKTGAIYAVADTGKRVVKLGGLDDTAEKASYKVVDAIHPKDPCPVLIALDGSAEPHALWVVARNWINGKVRRLTDAGDKFEDGGDPIAGKTAAMNFAGSAAVVGGKLFTRAEDLRINFGASPIVLDANTGAFERILKTKIPKNGNSVELTAGKDGSLYAHTNGWPAEGLISRLTPAGELSPFEAGRTILRYHGHTRTAGIFVTRFGDIYVPGGEKYRALNPGAVRVFGPDGRPKGEPVVSIAGAFFGGIAVDSRGNVYLGAQVAEKDKLIPEWFDGKLGRPTARGFPVSAYRHCGAVIKFKPSGGAIVPDPAGNYIGAAAYKRLPVALKNAEWLRRAGEVPARSGGADGVHCYCETTRFDIDGYDRLFVPDIHRFGVQVLDAAGNLIALVGSYGNMDNRGPKSEKGGAGGEGSEGSRSGPAIAYGWPLATQVVGDQLYVLDLNNRRVAVARLGCSISEACTVP